jgi:O-antigen ligase
MERRDGRMGGLIGDSNDYGVFVAFFLPAVFALFLSSSSKARPLALLGLLATIAGLAISASRGAYVAAVFGSAAAAFYLRSYIPARKIVQYAVGAVAVCIVVVAIVLTTEYRELLMDRFSESQTSEVQDLSSGRTALWSAILERMLENPTSFITGYGWQSFENENFRYSAHNRYLNLLYNLGLFGLFLFLLTIANIVRFARNALASADSEARPFLVALIFGLGSMLVSMLTADIFNPWIFIWAFCGVAVRIAAQTLSKAKPAEATELRTEIVRHRGPAWQGSMSQPSAVKRQLQ